MTDLDKLMAGLENTPSILGNLLDGIPNELLKERRKTGKWSIHENVCHLAGAEKMLIERFMIFKNEKNIKFEPYLPGKNVSDDHLISLDMHEEFDSFSKLRAEMVEFLGTYDQETWYKNAEHPEYFEYNPYILLRHVLMHDHFHMYRIEELWLTKDEFPEQ